MPGISTTGMSELFSRLEKIVEEAPETLERMHKELAGEMKGIVDSEIASAGFSDGGVKLQSYQEAATGSKGRYAAVRPKRTPSGKNGAAAVTGYNEEGHRIRSPGGKAKSYHPRIKKPYVSGRHFYASAGPKAESKAIAIAESYVEKLAKELGG